MNEETKQLTTDEARAEVLRIIEAAGVKFTVTHLGQRKRDGWVCDVWTATFSYRSSFDEDFEYSTGVGCRKLKPLAKTMQNKYRQEMTPRRFEQWKADESVPVAPHAADVLHSIVLDSSAVGQSFESWASDFGYDSDSRKAESMYLACQQNADKLARLFSAEQRAALSEALSNY